MAYNRVKAVRRILSAYGFTTATGELTGRFTKEQLQEYDGQMKELDDAQLTLETLRRKVEADDGRLFDRNRALIGAVEKAESYVNHVIDDWKHHRDDVRPRKNRAKAMADQERLSRFLGDAEAEAGIKVLSDSIGEAVRLVQKTRFSRED